MLSRSTATDDAIGFRARGRIQLDARTATAYGLLRTFVRFEMTRNTGVVSATTPPPRTSTQAFIQFGGLTAGRVTSFFDNSDLPTEPLRHPPLLGRSEREPVGLHLLVRQRLLGHPVGEEGALRHSC